MKGKVVKIIDTTSIIEPFIGRYGVIKGFAYGDKWKVELNAVTPKAGSLTHTVSEKDFEVVGEIY